VIEHGYYIEQLLSKFLTENRRKFPFNSPMEHGYDVVKSINAIARKESNGIFRHWAGIFFCHTG